MLSSEIQQKDSVPLMCIHTLNHCCEKHSNARVSKVLDQSQHHDLCLGHKGEQLCQGKRAFYQTAVLQFIARLGPECMTTVYIMLQQS